MSASKQKILLVDDDRDLLRLLSIRLSAAGYEVDTAESGEQAMAYLASSRPQLVITDLRMGGMDGMALFEAHTRAQSGAAGDHPHRARHDPGCCRGDPARRVRLPDQALRRQGAAGADRARTEAERPCGGQRRRDEDRAWRAEIITRSPLMEEMLRQAKLVAGSDASVLIHGESGTGKELLAQAIHLASPRRPSRSSRSTAARSPRSCSSPSCSATSRAPSPAPCSDHKGLFQAADGGTLFLDEIGDMPLPLQVKLLRVLQEKRGAAGGLDPERDGGRAHHLGHASQPGRGDRRGRLPRGPVLPPATSYRWRFRRWPSGARTSRCWPSISWSRLAEKYGKSINGSRPDALELLVTASWPGNVRQLYNVVEQAVALCDHAHHLRRAGADRPCATSAARSCRPSRRTAPLRARLSRQSAADHQRQRRAGGPPGQAQPHRVLQAAAPPSPGSRAVQVVQVSWRSRCRPPILR